MVANGYQVCNDDYCISGTTYKAMLLHMPYSVLTRKQQSLISGVTKHPFVDAIPTHGLIHKSLQLCHGTSKLRSVMSWYLPLLSFMQCHNKG
jgi:hypothetical protein